jgi:hypothetical protein
MRRKLKAFSLVAGLFAITFAGPAAASKYCHRCSKSPWGETCAPSKDNDPWGPGCFVRCRIIPEICYCDITSGPCFPQPKLGLQPF